MDLQTAIATAIRRSALDECTQHVNATVRITGSVFVDGMYAIDIPVAVTYSVSDWYSSDATVYTATNGVGDRT